MGLHDWTYERIECGAQELPGVVGGFGPEWVGVSVTMPGKFAALRFADEHTERAGLVGSANTLVRTPRGWRADNTDVDGVAGGGRLGPLAAQPVVRRANPQGELVELGVNAANAVAATGERTRPIAQANHDVIAGHARQH